MSRSRRRTPITSWTTSDSEKEDKVLYHRRYRRVVKDHLRKYQDDEVIPHFREHSDPYKWAKDGKQRIDPNSVWMRK